MGLIDWLLRRKPKARRMRGAFSGSPNDLIRETKAAISTVAVGDGPAGGRFPKLMDAAPELLTLTPTSAVVTKDGLAPSVNIWDIDKSSDPKTSEPGRLILSAPVPDAPASEARRRTSRTRTRVLGFEPQPTSVVPLFGEGRVEENGSWAAEALAAGQPSVVFPVGWLVVTAGPGRGSAFVLTRGVSQIGRGADQTVALDFGDMAISRQHHAAVRYDAVTHRLQIGHGGKSNLVRLNGKPLLSTETLADGDEIQIGETTLMLKVLCTAAFNWSEAEAEGDGHDMAIA